MHQPTASLLHDGKNLHLQHGPIDLIISADPVHKGDRRAAFAVATQHFDSILTNLVEELPMLRSQADLEINFDGFVATRMANAVMPHADKDFITPMAAVAGAVADEILAVMVNNVELRRASVNNGGDIAVYLAPQQSYKIGVVSLNGQQNADIQIEHEMPSRGIATSGQGGRSLSFGIAESVTVLARNAAMADAAATLIANAVNLPDHHNIKRQAANEIQPDSDLGARLVVIHCGSLSNQDIDEALNNGEVAAQDMLKKGLIDGAALFLRDKMRIVGDLSPQLDVVSPLHAPQQFNKLNSTILTRKINHA